MSLDKQVRDLFAKYQVDLARDDVWAVQQATVIKHKAVERLGAAAGIEWLPPTVLRAERDEAVILVRGRLGEREDWDIGECAVNVNYRVSGKQAAYVYAMAMKRGRDRLVLKLVGLHGFYSEEEADEFKQGRSGEITVSDLNEVARARAQDGTAIYSAFFISLSKAEKAALVGSGEHARNKSIALSADSEAAA